MRTLRGWLVVGLTAIGSAASAWDLPAQTAARLSLDDTAEAAAEFEADSDSAAGLLAGDAPSAVQPASYAAPVGYYPQAAPAGAPVSRPSGPDMHGSAMGAAMPSPWGSASPYSMSPGGYAPAFAGQMPVQPANYASMEMGMSGMGGGYGDPMAMYGDGGDPWCDSCYTDPAYPPNVVGNFVRGLLPFSEGGRCAPRWFDVALDAMYLKREDVGNNVGFASLGPGAANVVLSTQNLDYEEEPGFRFSAAILSGPGTNLEFTYFGLFNWASVASVADPANQLFSAYSNFGTTLPLSDQADLSQFQSLGTSSTIDNFEINVRRRWVGPNCRTQGSWLAGARYIYLLDDMQYFTLGRNNNGVPIGQSDTLVRARNSMTGFQAGGDLWANVLPGISIGGDFKAGVYGNYAKQNTTIESILTNNATAVLNEEASNNDIAVVGEANIMLIYRINPNFTFRGGYSFLYIDGLALSIDNFNRANPFNAARGVRELTDSAHVLYHGGFAGFEWMW